MTKGLIVKSMLDNLEYDQQSTEMSKSSNTLPAGQSMETPTAMFVFAGADLNAAAYHLVQSLEKPFAAGAIASLFVQEAVQERFIEIVKPKLPKYGADVTTHAGFQQALQSITRLNAKTVTGPAAGALLVCDVAHEHLGVGASGVVTLHTFRTAKEAIALFAKETLTFKDLSIWNENYSCAYELVAALRSHNFFINCHQVSLEPIKTQAAAAGNYVIMDKSYHYETFSVNGLQKNVVFPIGTIFAN